MYTFKSIYLDYPIITGRIYDIFEPETITKDTAIFFVHGGGWRGGSRTKFHEIMQAYNNLGYIVASTDYKLYAKDAFEQVKDIREAYDNFISYLKEKGRPLKVAVFGESAGAHIAALMCYVKPNGLDENCVLKNEWVKPECVILSSCPHNFYHWEGIMTAIWNGMKSIAGGSYETDYDKYVKLSVENYIDENNPRTFYVEAEREHFFDNQATKEICKKQNQMGIKSFWKLYSKMEHGFFYELKRNAQKEAFQDIADFIEGRLNLNND